MSILPLFDYVLQVEKEIKLGFGLCYFSRNLYLFTISIDVLVTIMKLFRPVGVFELVGLVELEVVVMVGGHMRMKLPIRGWNGSMKKETLRK